MDVLRDHVTFSLKKAPNPTTHNQPNNNAHVRVGAAPFLPTLAAERPQTAHASSPGRSAPAVSPTARRRTASMSFRVRAHVSSSRRRLGVLKLLTPLSSAGGLRDRPEIRRRELSVVREGEAAVWAAVESIFYSGEGGGIATGTTAFACSSTAVGGCGRN